MKQKTGRKLLGVLLALALVVGLLPGISLTAFADDDVQYPLWVGGTQVTSENKDDILEDGGKATYDPTSNTLTLKNPTIQNLYDSGNSTNVIYSTLDNLVIKGSATLSNQGGSNNRGIYARCLELNGDFSIVAGYYGISASSLTITDGNITVKGTLPVNTGGPININGGILTADGSGAAISGSTITIANGLTIVEPQGGKISTGENSTQIANADGTTTAQHVVIKKPVAVVTTRPTANTLTANGAALPLVSAGKAIGGEMQYAIGTGSETAPTDGWSASIPTGVNAGIYYVWYKVEGDENHNNVDSECLIVSIKEKEEQKSSNGTITTDGIYCASNHPSIQAGMVIHKSNEADTVEYRWVACDSNKPGEWFEVSPWTKNNNCIDWTPEKSGSYVIVCYARVVGNEKKSEIQFAFGTEYHKEIKGICQMPYSGEGGGYLIGIESYNNPNNSYQYEMLILDCTLYAQGKDAWIYTTGRCGAKGNSLWTVWQPQYGYYWTLFRIYDADGNIIDEACYGFANVN